MNILINILVALAILAFFLFIAIGALALFTKTFSSPLTAEEKEKLADQHDIDIWEPRADLKPKRKDND
jgi:hypothetical protein